MADPAYSAWRDFVRLIAFAKPYLPIIAIAIVAAWMYGAALSGRALLLQPLVDDVALPGASLDVLNQALESESADAAALEEERGFVRERVIDNFTQILIAGFLLVLGMPVVRLIRDYASYWVMHRVHADLQSAVGRKLVNLPLAHHVREGRGDFVARLSSDTQVANRAHVVVFGDVVEYSGIVVASLALAFYVSWQLTLVVCLIGPPTALVLQVFGKRIRRSAKRRQEQVSDVTQRLVQMLSGIKVIKAFHAEEREAASFQASVMRYFRRSIKVIRNRVLSRGLIELVTQGSFISVTFLGIWMVVWGGWDLTLGKLMAFLGISAMLYRPVRGMAQMYNTVQDALPAAARVFEVLDAEEVTPDQPGAVDITRVERGIRFENVSFAYDREVVLSNLNLELEAGQVVALVGRSGAGKTTIADLLLRFHDPLTGRITIDGRDVAGVKRGSLHEITAIVTQESFLFDDTVLANLRYGRPEASMEDVIAAARAANVHEFIVGLPQGYETQVGEVGGQLSGGQRQRMTIARAILRDPQILVFDEATSALDAQAEREVQGAINNLMQGRTVLLIAHRLSTVKAADKIAVLEGGEVTTTGTHDELVARGGLYRDLVEAQLISETTAA